jgi:hypothetical protein
MGYISAANVSVTEPTQFTTKSYVDTQNATKLNLSGGTITGPISWNFGPELSTHLVNR